MSDHIKRLAAIRNGFVTQTAKPVKGIKPISDKRSAKMAADKSALGGDDTAKEKWFLARRKEMVGVCQCGCAQKSSKFDDNNFRSSAAHILPKGIFNSVKYHPLNWVERAIWATSTSSSCHTNMDNGSMDKWPMYADWEDIKERFHALAPCLTDEERAHKFYTHLEKLIYEN